MKYKVVLLRDGSGGGSPDGMTSLSFYTSSQAETSAQLWASSSSANSAFLWTGVEWRYYA